MADKIISQLPSGSISDTSLGLIGDPVSGSLSQTSYRAMKDYFQQGVTVSTGSLATTASLNVLSSSYSQDSGSFNSRIIALSGSLQSLTGSYVTTGSFNSYTSSQNAQVNNVYSSQSNYETTASYQTDSGSFNSRIIALSGSIQSLTGSYVTSGAFNNYTSSTAIQIANVYASESNYTLSSSFLVASASFNTRISNITGSAATFLNFVVGDGQSFTPSQSSTVFSSSLIANRTVVQVSQEGFILAPISRPSTSWYSVTSSIGKINLNGTSFATGSFFQIVYQ